MSVLEMFVVGLCLFLHCIVFTVGSKTEGFPSAGLRIHVLN